MVNKGISPLIASVLLIAFTISISAILVNYVMDFGKKNVKTTDKGTKQVECTFAGINLREASFNCTVTDRLNFEIENTGSKKINKFGLRTFFENKSVKVSDLKPEVSMKTGDVNYFYKDNFTLDNTTKFEVFVKSCPIHGIDTVTKSEIKKC